ncbi:MAG: YihY/virulence factor BrkB family protein [Proteobacteria bacterium]|nr:YihY/virulence factor BrkB family protein [Pseudomonadota bacterium]
MLQQLKKKIDDLLWGTSFDGANKLQLFLLRALRIFYGAIRDLSGGLPSLRAMGLVYTTLLSLVPLLAVSFSVLKGFGAHNQLEPMLLDALEPLGEKGLQIGQQIISFVDNIKVGVLGSIGLLVLIFTVLSLVKKIESAFNFTWRITVSRGIIQRFSNYLSVILLGPLLLFTATGIRASFNSSAVVNSVLSIEPFGTILLVIGETLPFILTISSFTFIYILIPNTKVRISSAFYGAVIAATLWKISGTIFALFIVDSTNYTAIYSGFAILIIFMIWIYVNWLIVLTGTSIAYYHQNPDRISNQSQIIRLSCRLREKLALTVMQLIADSFHHNKTAWTAKTLAKETSLSEQAITLILSSLIANNLLTTTGENNKQFLPSQSLENIKLGMILNAARSAEETSQLRPEDVVSVKKVDDTLEAIENAISASCKNTSLKDLI